MKRGSRPRKLKPYITIDGLKAMAENNMWGHEIEWKEEKTTEAIAICTRCNAVAVIVLRPAGIENVITGDAVNKECPNRHEVKNA